MLSSLKKTFLSTPLSIRSFSASATQLKGISLSSHPYVHTHPVNKGYAVSYVSSKDIKDSDHLSSDVIIGWTQEKNAVDPANFVENAKFVDFMTKVFKEKIHKINDPNLKALADWQKEGWLHVGDERNPPPWGRINFPEDIIGSVQLQNGTIKEGTYEPMPTHRMVTNNGLFQMSEPLTQCIIDAAKKHVSKSSS